MNWYFWSVFVNAFIFFLVTAGYCQTKKETATYNILSWVGFGLFCVYLFGAGQVVAINDMMDYTPYPRWIMPGIYWALTVYSGVVWVTFHLTAEKEKRSMFHVSWAVVSGIIFSGGVVISGALTVASK